MACMYYIGFINEYTIYFIQDALLKPDAIKLVEEILAKKSLLSNNSVPKVAELLARYAYKETFFLGYFYTYNNTQAGKLKNHPYKF